MQRASMVRAMLLVPPDAAMTRDLVGELSGFDGIELTTAHDVDEALRFIPDIEVLFTFFAERRLLEAARSLRWIQALISGTDRIELDEAAARRIVLSNARGFHGTPVSEAALAMMLALGRDLPRAVRNQAAHAWQPWNARLLAGSTLLIVGVGAIAAALGLKCKALGMRVEGISRTVREVAGFDLIRPREALRDAVAEADYVVLLAPADASSRGLFGREVIAAMKSTSFLINVARGSLVDDDALIDALRRGRIAGAALDAVNDEPLGPEHRYWEVPRLILTPHMAGRHEGSIRALFPLLKANWSCYRAGDLQHMANRVNG